MWMLEAEKEAVMVDNVESSWRGVLDLSYNERENFLFGLSQGPGGFSLYGTNLDFVSKEPKKTQK